MNEDWVITGYMLGEESPNCIIDFWVECTWNDERLAERYLRRLEIAQADVPADLRVYYNLTGPFTPNQESL